MKKILFLIIYFNSIMCSLAGGIVDYYDPDSLITFAYGHDYVATGDLGGRINIYNNITLDFIKSFDGHNRSVSQISFSPDGKYLASCSDSILVHEIKTGNVIFDLDKYGAPFSYNFDGSKIVCVSGRNIKILDTTSGTEIMTIMGNNTSIISISYIAEGNKILSAFENCIKIFDTNDGLELKTIQENRGVMSASFDRNGTKIIANYYSNSKMNLDHELIKIYDANNYNELKSFTYRYDDLRTSFFSPDDKNIIVATSYPVSQRISVVDYITGENINGIPHGNRYTGEKFPIAINNDGKRIFYTENGKDIKIWEIE
jgi:WD40 repeat protein